MTKILGTNGATDSGLSLHNHRAFVRGMARVLESRKDLTKSVPEILDEWDKPENALVKADALKYAATNALNAANEFIDKEEVQAALAKQQASAPAPVKKTRAAPPPPPEIVVRAEKAMAKTAEVVAKSKELTALYTLDTVMPNGLRLAKCTRADLAPMHLEMGRLIELLPEGVPVGNVFTAETLVKALQP